MTRADLAARDSALLVGQPELGTLVVTGPERLTWLHAVLTADVATLAAGEGCWALALTKQGKILADVLVVAGPEAVYLGVPAGTPGRLLEWLRQFLIMEDADVDDASASHEWATLHGPEALAGARGLAEALHGHAAPADLTGLGGAALVVPRGSGGALEAGAAARGLTVATAEEWRRLRVERLVPAYGEDVDESRNPHEASLDRRAVSWTKGCYLGQEAVCMQDMRGKVKRRLAVLALADAPVPERGTAVTTESGDVVGETRTATRSERLGGTAAIAMLAAAAAVPGTALRVGGSRAVVVDPAA